MDKIRNDCTSVQDSLRAIPDKIRQEAAKTPIRQEWEAVKGRLDTWVDNVGLNTLVDVTEDHIKIMQQSFATMKQRLDQFSKKKTKDQTKQLNNQKKSHKFALVFDDHIKLLPTAAQITAEWKAMEKDKDREAKAGAARSSLSETK